MVLLWHFTVAWLVLLISQGIFAWANSDLFSIANVHDGWRIVLGNMKFAASATAICMWPCIAVTAATSLVLLLMHRFQKTSSTTIEWIMLRWSYGISMALMLAANVTDTSYYRWTFRRMTWDIFHYAGDNFNGGWGALLLQFLHDFWVYFLLFFALLTVLLWLSGRIKLYKEKQDTDKYRKKAAVNIILFLVTIFLNASLQRGGFINQHKPLRVVDASRYASGNNTALILNSPFSILRTIGHSGGLKELTFFDDQTELETIFSPRYLPDTASATHSVWTGTPRDLTEHPDRVTQTVLAPGNRPNIVLIILESIGEEYIGDPAELLPDSGTPAKLLPNDHPSASNKLSSETHNHNVCYAPFLDSLRRQGTVLMGRANGKRSIESVPALLSGIPSLMEDAYITSPYSQSRIVTLAQQLKEEGYRTAFFHGAYNGSMNFDSYVRGIGIDYYYGKDQFNDVNINRQGPEKGAFDGTWGIFDEPFLQFAAQRLTEEYSTQPFFATLYTISSHHPYTIPPQHKGRFAKGPQPILESIGYADYAVKQFFATACRQGWYGNTLFIITADHTSQPINSYYKHGEGQYAVPMIFFWPGHQLLQFPDIVANRYGTGWLCPHLMQHADLYPTLADLLGLSKPCYAFGTSVLASRHLSSGTNRPTAFHIAYEGNGTYLFASDRDCISTIEIQPDNLQPHDYTPATTQNANLRHALAVLQQYTHRLIKNNMAD